MIDICFGHSNAGATKCRLLLLAKSKDKAMEMFKEQFPNKDKEIDFFFSGNGKYCNSEEILFFSLNFDIGDIQEDAFSKRKDFLIKKYQQFEVPIEECEEIWQREVETLNAIISAAEKGEPMRIWVDAFGEVQCAYYFLCSVLQKYDVKILFMYTPIIFGFSDSSTENLFTHATIKGKAEIAKDAKVWEKLVADNKLLRVMEDGKIKSVDLDYYDDFILSIAPKEKISVCKLSGEAMGQKIKMTYNFVEDRISYLIEQRKFKVVGYRKVPDYDKRDNRIIIRNY